MKTAEQWVSEEKCPQEWASAEEVRAIQSDAREDLIVDIREAIELLEKSRIIAGLNVLRRAAYSVKERQKT